MESVQTLRQQRAEVALALAEGRADESALRDLEKRLAEAELCVEREELAREARVRREAAERAAEARAAELTRRKRLRRAALDRIEAAESLEASFADVEAALADYLSSSDVLGDRGRPAAWWLQHRLNSLFPFDFPRSPRRMGEPLAEYERERLADHITEEEAQ